MILFMIMFKFINIKNHNLCSILSIKYVILKLNKKKKLINNQLSQELNIKFKDNQLKKKIKKFKKYKKMIL